MNNIRRSLSRNENYGRNCKISGETLKQYADSLKAISHQVRQGIYCKDRMTDAVLCAWKSNLEKEKIELHYEIEGYDRGEIEEQDLAKT